MRYELYKNDLPAGLSFGSILALDNEMMGLNVKRDRLCLAQIWDGEQDTVHMVQFEKDQYDAPNLKALLSDPEKMKIFYFARGDMRWVGQYLDIILENTYCTKIAARIAETYIPHHELEDTLKRQLGVTMSKEEQCTWWGAEELTDAQLKYAMEDVLYLHELREKLDRQMDAEGRKQIAYDLFGCLPAIVRADLAGWQNDTIFDY